MLSAVAPMSMSEERQRGSLDLLAATTLSTPTIVLGKWLGTLRLVLLLAIGPGLMGFALATADKIPAQRSAGSGTPASIEELSRGELLFGAGLLVATILVHGALLASVGLALATWIKRQGRAIAAQRGVRRDGGRRLADLRRGQPHGRAWRRGLTCLSPVVAAGELAGLLADASTDTPRKSSGGPHSGTSSAWCWPSASCG